MDGWPQRGANGARIGTRDASTPPPAAAADKIHGRARRRKSDRRMHPGVSRNLATKSGPFGREQRFQGLPAATSAQDSSFSHVHPPLPPRSFLQPRRQRSVQCWMALPTQSSILDLLLEAHATLLAALLPGQVLRWRAPIVGEQAANKISGWRRDFPRNRWCGADHGWVTGMRARGGATGREM